MTSAPRSARMVVATGPAMKLAASMTRTPASNAAALMARAAMSRASRRRRLALGEEPERQQGDADADRGVRDIERRPVPAVPVHVHEIDDGAEARAVDEIADGAAEDEPDRDHARQTTGGQHAQRHASQHQQRDDRERG